MRYQWFQCFSKELAKENFLMHICMNLGIDNVSGVASKFRVAGKKRKNFRFAAEFEAKLQSSDIRS